MNDKPKKKKNHAFNIDYEPVFNIFKILKQNLVVYQDKKL